MTLSKALLFAGLSAVVLNRIVAVFAGLWWQVPPALLLGVLIVVDLVQIPMFYWIFDHSAFILARLPARIRRWFEKDWAHSSVGRRASSWGGVGVMLVAAMPTLGGGIWSATFIAYGLGLRRRHSYAWLILGSLLSYVTLYWIIDTLVSVSRYFLR